MDAVTAITNDHRVLEQLVARLQSGQGDRLRLVAEVDARLRAHSIAEEEHVYPRLVRREPVEVGHGVDEHDTAELKLAAVWAALDGPDFEPAVREFVAAVRMHLRDEEKELLPSLRDAVAPAVLEQLGADFEERRIGELALAGMANPAAPPDLA
jgi:hypothetical protein